jgi:small GTP-binding protein
MELDRITSIPSAKIVFLGNSSTGKTSLANRFIHNTFDHYTESTIGASFASKTIDLPEYAYNPKIKFHIWDTAGQEK